ncbi:hypothetical protein [Billgrantia montanilacus]|uniref:DUF2459 domain-containing protein n=1 Tax=Billgrantia montanilacus TaxID=2282305 RepID=A0A368TXN0_9GAMM|nr:hypothetical protein [Halomonas montanilacus]RCV89474.1 hypothetical protein DU505_10580 [Halomonas montanilacus]
MHPFVVTWRLFWLLLVVLPMSGCTGRVMPPAPAELSQPLDVYLLDHGRHASLVLPVEEGGMVRYSYGEWRWYVEGRRHFLAGAAAMLVPTASALGRGVYEDVTGPGDFSRLAPEGLIRTYPLRAEAWRVRALQRRLDAHFSGEIEPVYSEEFGLHFVPHPRAYWAAHQSNLVVAGWLRQLDIDIQGIPWYSRWRIEPPQDAR